MTYTAIHSEPRPGDQLCDVAVTAVAPDAMEFLTGQIPERDASWLPGCALRLAGVDEGARFWRQYAAAESTPAAYCLALYHQAHGDSNDTPWGLVGYVFTEGLKVLCG